MGERLFISARDPIVAGAPRQAVKRSIAGEHGEFPLRAGPILPIQRAMELAASRFFGALLASSTCNSTGFVRVDRESEGYELKGV